MTQMIELFYDFRSPNSYLAFTQLRKMDVEIAFGPMKILEVMEKVGNVPTTITCAAKGRYARDDLGRWAVRYGISLNPADMKLVDGDLCSRAVLAAASPAEASEVTLALYRACWQREMQPDKTDDYFITPDSIAAEVYHLAHQPRDAWTFRAELRPFHEPW